MKFKNKLVIIILVVIILVIIISLFLSPKVQLGLYELKYNITGEYKDLVSLADQLYKYDKYNNQLYDEKTMDMYPKYFPVLLEDKNKFLKYKDKQDFSKFSARYLLNLLYSNQLEKYSEEFDRYYKQIIVDDKIVDFYNIYNLDLILSKFTDEQLNVMLQGFQKYEDVLPRGLHKFCLYSVLYYIYIDLNEPVKANEMSQKQSSM